MTDPVAEAAAKIAADMTASIAEPSLLERAMDTIHDLEAKVEHLIHPETSVNAVSELIGQHDDSDVHHADEGVEAPNVPEASTSGTLPESTPSADTSITTGSVTSSGGEVGNVDAGAAAPATTTLPMDLVSTSADARTTSTSTLVGGSVELGNSSGSSATEQSGEPLSSSTPIDGDLPNAAPAVVEQPVIAASAQDASGSDTQAVVPSVHESLLRKIITVLERDFNMFSGELKQLMTEAKTHL